MPITIAGDRIIFPDSSEQTAPLIGPGGYLYTYVNTVSLTLSFQNWVTTNEFLVNVDGTPHIVTITWSYTGTSEYSYFTGSDIIAGSAGTANPLAVSQYREMIGGGSYGEQVHMRLLTNVSGNSGKLQFFYWGRAGYGNTYTSPSATIKVWRLVQ